MWAVGVAEVDDLPEADLLVVEIMRSTSHVDGGANKLRQFGFLLDVRLVQRSVRAPSGRSLEVGAKVRQMTLKYRVQNI